MKKILVLTSSYPKNDNDQVIKFVKNQLVFLSKYYKDLSFCVLTPYLNKSNESNQSDGIKVIRFHYFIKKYENLNDKGIMTNIKKNFLNIFLIIPYFVSQIINAISLNKNYKPDIVYAHWITTQGIVALFLKKIYGTPYVLTTHAHDGTILLKLPFFGKVLLKSIINNSNAWTADSKTTKNKIINSIGKTKNNCLVAPMFFDSEIYDSYEIDKSKFNLKSSKKYILFIGRFTQKKGLIEFLELFSDELKNNEDWELLIAGGGPLLEMYKNSIIKLDLQKKVNFLGYLNIKDKKSLFDIVDLVIIPSVITNFGDAEGLPTVLIESMYNNKITFSSITSNAPEIILDGINGFLFDYNDSKGSKEKFLKILNLNDKLKIQIAGKAKESVKQFETKNNVELFYNHLFKGS